MATQPEHAGLTLDELRLLAERAGNRQARDEAVSLVGGRDQAIAQDLKDLKALESDMAMSERARRIEMLKRREQRLGALGDRMARGEDLATQPGSSLFQQIAEMELGADDRAMKALEKDGLQKLFEKKKIPPVDLSNEPKRK